MTDRKCIIHRPDWSVAPSAAQTIIGENYGCGDAFEIQDSHELVAVPENLPAGLEAEWNQGGGGAATMLAVAQAQAMSALNELEEGVVNEVMTSFDALSANTQKAVFAELSLGGVGRCRAATDAEVAKVKSDPAGAELMQSFGGRAATALGKIKVRVQRIEASLSNQESDTLWGMIRNLDESAAIAIFKTLAK